MDIQECIDCNIYEDVYRDDSFLIPFGPYFICPTCAEERGVES